MCSSDLPTVKHRSRMAWHVADRKAREATGVAHALAVSLEPAGGSPTGAPTGPVLFVGKLAL